MQFGCRILANLTVETEVLRFIVLGQVPGTQIQINFMELVVLGLLGALIFEMFLNRRRQALALAEITAIASAPKKSRTRAKKPMTKRKPARKSTTKRTRAKQTKLDKMAL